MVNEGKTTLQLPVKTAIYDANDAFIFVYGRTTANTANSIAQTAIMNVSNSASALFTFPFPTYTFSTLPTAAAGVLVNISDANTITWGANITVGNGTHNVLARYNGSNWTVVGI